MEEVSFLSISPALECPTDIINYKDGHLIVLTRDGVFMVSNEKGKWKSNKILDESVDCICVSQDTFIISDGQNRQMMELELLDGKLVPLQDGIHEEYYYPPSMASTTDQNCQNIKRTRCIYAAYPFYVHKIFPDESEDERFHIVAGSGSSGYKNGPLLEARFSHLTAIALDKHNNLVVTDRTNMAIRYIDFSSGLVSTIVDHSINQLIRCPSYISLDNRRNIAYVTESCTNVLRIYLDSNVVESVTSCYFAEPCGLCLNSDNNILYLCDRSDNAIYEFKLRYPTKMRWKIARLIWIGHLKEHQENCPFARIPREMVFLIINTINSSPYGH